MNAQATAIPFEGQGDPQGRRDCGAACLRMVYSSIGLDVPQAEIWPAVAKPNQFGSVASTTHLMAKDALSRGVAAIVFQARHPIQALRLCCESGARAILNHRPTRESWKGHYSVLIDINNDEVVLHDPFYGPSRHLPHAELLELWRPGQPNSEIAGFTLIALAAESAAPPAPCWLCSTPMPAAAVCPRCKQEMGLQPSAALGCIDAECIARMWNYMCCPFCDSAFDLGAQAGLDAPTSRSQGTPAPASSAAQPKALDFSRMFAEIDKFCNLVLTIPGAADHAEIRKQMDFIAASKEKLKAQAAEALAHRKGWMEQLSNAMKAAKDKEESHRRKLEVNSASAPLDGDSLGRALLRNLGLSQPE